MSLILASAQEAAEQSTKNAPRKATVSDHYLPILKAITGKEPARYEAAVGNWLNSFKESCFITDPDLGGRFLKPNPTFEQDPSYSILADLSAKLSEKSKGSLINCLYGDPSNGKREFVDSGKTFKFDDEGRLKDEFFKGSASSLWIEDGYILEMLDSHFATLCLQKNQSTFKLELVNTL